MRMTFNMWIKKQKDIYGELQNQQYDSPKKQWKFFDNRINCVLGTARHSEQSYEGMFQENKDSRNNSKKEEEAKRGRKHLDEDIEFGEEEQKFFRKIFEMFPTSEKLTLIEEDKWEEFDIEDRLELFNITVDMLENNGYWFPLSFGNWDLCNQWAGGKYQCKEDELEAKLFFPHMYRIKSKLIELKGEMLQYSELNKDKLIDEEKEFEQDLDRYLSILDSRATEMSFIQRVNKKIAKIQQLRCGLFREERLREETDEREIITEEDRYFEAGLDRYLNWLDEDKNGIDYARRIINKIEYIEKMWSIYDVRYSSAQINKNLDISELKITIPEVILEANEDIYNRYCKLGEKMEQDSKEDDVFEEKLKEYIELLRKAGERQRFGKEYIEETAKKYAKKFNKNVNIKN